MNSGILESVLSSRAGGTADEHGLVLSVGNVVRQQLVVGSRRVGGLEEQFRQHLGQHMLFARQVVEADEQLLCHGLVADDGQRPAASAVGENYDREPFRAGNLSHLAKEELDLGS